MTINLKNLTAADLANLLAQLSDMRDEQKTAQSNLLTDLVTTVVADPSAFGEAQTFATGAEGYRFSDSTVFVPVGTDGEGDDASVVHRVARVSLLIRWDDTIPAKEKAAEKAAEKAEKTPAK